MLKSKEISITVNGSEVKVVTEIDLIFSEFSEWTRARFQIPSDELIVFKNADNKEIIPGKEWLKKNDKVVVERLPTKIDSLKQSESITVKSSKQQSNHAPASPLFEASIVLALFSFIIGTFFQFQSRLIDVPFLEPIVSIKHDLIQDAIASSIAWGVSYLFVRRLWNPETMSVALQKFTLDAIFGGIAAGFTVLIKTSIKHMI